MTWTHTPNTPKITFCTLCPHTGATCRPGYDLARNLCRSIEASGDMIADDFEISGHVEMRCMRPCIGVFHATKTACHLFGDVKADADIPALLAAPDPAASITLEHCGPRLS